jgi:hypothetical protein
MGFVPQSRRGPPFFLYLLGFTLKTRPADPAEGTRE